MVPFPVILINHGALLQSCSSINGTLLPVLCSYRLCLGNIQNRDTVVPSVSNAGVTHQ